MKIGVLSSPTSWYWKDLYRANEDRHDLECIDFRELQAGIDSHEWAGFPDRDFDAILVRTMPPGSLEQVVFRMNALARWQALGVRIVNSPRSLETAIDKYLTLALLESNGILVPKTCVSQTVEQAMESFEALGQDVVIKPLFGGEGRGMVRVTDIDIALRTVKALVATGSVIYIQEFIEHGAHDFRILKIGDDAFGMKRVNHGDWRKNVSLGAQVEGWSPDLDFLRLANRAQSVIGAEIVGIDLLQSDDGNVYVIEANAVPGWKAMASVCGVDIARRVLNYLRRKPVPSNAATSVLSADQII